MHAPTFEHSQRQLRSFAFGMPGPGAPRPPAPSLRLLVVPRAVLPRPSLDAWLEAFQEAA